MPIHARSYLTLLAFSSLAAACGGGGSDPDQLVASWVEVPGTLDPDEQDLLVFTADGTFTTTESDGDVTTGTYEADETALTITGTEDGETHTFRMLYALEADELMLGALFPDGDVDGVVGTWRGEAAYDGAEATAEITLDPDGTGRYVVNRADGEIDDHTGTWAPLDEEFVFTYEEVFEETEITINVHFQQIPGVAIGGPLFRRQ
jgi:hypothetical protein